MNGVDGLILGVGVIVLAASILGVALYDEEAGSAFTVRFEQSEEQQLEALSDNGGPGTFEFSVPVNASGLAGLSFTIDVAANGANVAEDTVAVDVQGPSDLSSQCDFVVGGGPLGNEAGTCTATLTVQDQPPSQDVQATSEEEAVEKARGAVDLSLGQGTYVVTVTIDGGQEVQDPSYTVELTPSFTQYNPVATPASPDATGP